MSNFFCGGGEEIGAPVRGDRSKPPSPTQAGTYAHLEGHSVCTPCKEGFNWKCGKVPPGMSWNVD